MTVSKILICGISGAGKTTLTRALSQSYGHKPLHLDQFFWKDNWTKTPEKDFYDLLDQETSKDRWILEGAILKIVRRYSAKADLVVWLCPNRTTAIFRVLKRMILNYGKVREEMPPGCYEKIDLEFIKWIWNYPTSKYPELEKIFEEAGVKVVKIKNATDLKKFKTILEQKISI